EFSSQGENEHSESLGSTTDYLKTGLNQVRQQLQEMIPMIEPSNRTMTTPDEVDDIASHRLNCSAPDFISHQATDQFRKPEDGFVADSEEAILVISEQQDPASLQSKKVDNASAIVSGWSDNGSELNDNDSSDASESKNYMS